MTPPPQEDCDRRPAVRSLPELVAAASRKQNNSGGEKDEGKLGKTRGPGSPRGVPAAGRLVAFQEPSL